MEADALSYVTTIDGLADEAFEGFFENWPNPPGAAQLRTILGRSYAIVLALDGPRAVGFVNAISDGELFAFVPMVEVQPEYRHRKIGTELLTRLLERLDGIYAVDLSCDTELVPFYEALGFQSSGNAMIIRNFASQSGLSHRH